MPLLDVRKQFAIYSGRYDLVVDRITYADKGANFFIRAGQQYLDRTFDIFKAESRFYSDLPVNSWYVLTPDCRVVEEVYLNNSVGARVRLHRMSLDEYKLLSKGSSTCCPSFAVSNLRVTPAVSGTVNVDFGITVPGDDYNSTGILLVPTTTSIVTCEVYGKFYQPKLVADTDVSVWSELYQVVLVMAACRELEISYRNTVGVKDWENAITSEIHGVELDYADQESNYITKFRG